MSINLKKFGGALRFGLLGALLGGATLASAVKADAAMVISEIYGGGGNAGATYQNDFVELYNNGPTAVPLSGYTIQYASATGAFATTNNQVSTIATGTIAPYSFFLVQLAGATTNGIVCPSPPTRQDSPTCLPRLARSL